MANNFLNCFASTKTHFSQAHITCIHTPTCRIRVPVKGEDRQTQGTAVIVFCYVLFWVFFLKCPYKDKYVQVLTSGSSVQQTESRKGQWWSLHKHVVLESGDWPAMARHRLLHLYRQQYGSWEVMNFLHILRMQEKEVNFTHLSSVNTGLRRMKTGIANPPRVWQVDRHSHTHLT